MRVKAHIPPYSPIAMLAALVIGRHTFSPSSSSERAPVHRKGPRLLLERTHTLSPEPSAPYPGPSTGFSLLEVLISLGIFGIVASSVALGFINFLRFNTDAEIRTGAAAVAQETIEAYRYADPTALPSSGTTTTSHTMDGREYDIATTFCAEPTFCATANNRHITVEVTYRGVQQYSVETVYTQLQ